MHARTRPEPAAALIAIAIALASGAPAANGPAPAEEPFIGLSLRDTDHGPVVGWVFPGPFGGTGFGSAAGVRRGDMLVLAGVGHDITDQNRRTMASREDLDALIASVDVGETITVRFRRPPDAEAGGAVPRGGAGGETFDVTVTVAERDRWSGTIGRGLGERTIDPPRAPGEFENLILEEASALGILDADGGLSSLLDLLRDVQDRALDPNSLPAVVNALRHPLAIDAVVAPIAEHAADATTGDPRAIEALARLVLDIPPGVKRDASAAANLPDLRPRAERLVRRLRDSVYIYDERAEEHIGVIRATAGAIAPWLDPLLDLETRLEAVRDIGERHADAEPLKDVPADVRRYVTGDVLHYERLPSGALGVVGGPGDNTYDMRAVAWVYDVGGNDVYRFGSPDIPGFDGNHVIIDLDGHDVYESEDDFAGPGVGVFGTSIIEDHAGDDIFRGSGIMSVGAGLFGVGVIIAHAGDNIYENLGPGSGWSLGAGFYGAGIIVDREGDDIYHGEKLVQGVGGPRGFGAIIDGAGDDRYRADGPNFPSVYGTEGVHVSMSQGFGIGVRGYAAGGLGAIYDLDGDDVYEAGEFSQACGYYFAIGVLHDFAGNDRYLGNRYSQGTGAHQAAGILIDEEGDDDYRGRTAASQGAAWDQTVGVLIDRAGNDVYEAQGLAQGAAAQQALGLLIDLGGDDRFRAGRGAVQGRSGSDEYHYATTGVFSFSALITLGSGDNTFSEDRTPRASTATGERAPDASRSSLHGMVVDR